MANYNIELRYYNGSGYDLLYPKCNLSNVIGSIDIDLSEYTKIQTGSIKTFFNPDSFTITANFNPKLIILDGVTCALNPNNTSETIYQAGIGAGYSDTTSGVGLGYYKIEKTNTSIKFTYMSGACINLKRTGGFVLEGMTTSTNGSFLPVDSFNANFIILG